MTQLRTVVLDARATTPHFPGVARATLGLLAGLAVVEHQYRINVLAGDVPPVALPAFADPRLRRVAVDVDPLGAAQQWRLPALQSRLRAGLWHAPYYVRPFWRLPPTVVTVYDIIGRVVPGALPSLRARLLYEALMRLSLRSAALLIVSSEATRADLLAAYSVAAAGVRVIPLAAGDAFRPQPARAVRATRDRYNLPERYLLYVGSNKPHKNLPALLEAFARLHTDAALVVAGRWDPRYPEAREAARALGLDGRVRWLPDVDDTALAALMTGALGFVFPSRYEGFGLPPLEAMQCGAPVVVSDASSLPEVVGDAGLLVTPSVTALAEAMQRLLDDPALRERLSAAGIARAARFSWAETARRTVRVWDELAR